MKTTYGTWLRSMRQRQGWTQAEMAERSGVPTSHLSKLERGTIGLPSPATRARLHAALGTTADDLVRVGILTRIDGEHGRTPVYIPAGDKPAPLPPVLSEADVLTVSVRDPRADVLALLEGLTDDEVRSVTSALRALLRIAPQARDTQHSPMHHTNTRTA